MHLGIIPKHDARVRTLIADNQPALDRFTIKRRPADIIPKFEAPVYQWARRVRQILEYHGVVNFHDPVASSIFVPEILTKVPPKYNVPSMSCTLEELLRVLSEVDRQFLSLSDIQTSRLKLNISPSNTFHELVAEIKYLVPTYTDSMVKRTAWSHVYALLPRRLREHADVMDAVIS